MGLKGKTILLTRARHQSANLRRELIDLGAEVIEIPTIEIREPVNWKPVDQAIQRLSEYDWVIFTSSNGVDAFLGRLGVGRLRHVAAVGPETAARLRQRGQPVERVPANFRSEGLLESFPANLDGLRILLPRAERAGKALPESLRKRGASVEEVVVYRTVPARQGRNRLRELLEAERIDCIVFTSGSTVESLIGMLGETDAPRFLAHPSIAVIGPVTERVALEAGLDVDVIAENATIQALVSAIREYFDPA